MTLSLRTFLLAIITFSFSLQSWASLPEEHKELLQSLQSDSSSTRVLATKKVWQLRHKAPAFLNQANLMLTRYIADAEKYDISEDEAVRYVKLLRFTGDAEHIKTLEILLKSEVGRLVRASKKSLKHALIQLNVNTFAKSLNDKYDSMSHSMALFTAMLKSKEVLTREEGARIIYNSFLATRNRKADNPFKLDLADYSNEKLLSMLNSSVVGDQGKATKILFYMGAKDKSLYKRIALHAEAMFEEIATTSDERAKRIASKRLIWLSKSLSSSGDSQYIPLIDRAIALNDRTLTHYAKQSKSLVPEFAKWYAKLAKVDSFEDLSERELYLLVLDAPFLSIKNPGVRHFISARLHDDPEVLALCHEEFSLFYPYVRRNGRQVAPAVYMLKIMGLSGDEKYLPVMEAALTAPSKHVVADAEANIKRLKKIYREKNGITWAEAMSSKLKGESIYQKEP